MRVVIKSVNDREIDVNNGNSKPCCCLVREPSLLHQGPLEGTETTTTQEMQVCTEAYST